MKKLFVLSLLIPILILVLNCAKTKKLTLDEYEILSPEEKIIYLEKYVKSNPDDMDSRRKLYKEYLAQDMPNKAIEVLEKMIQKDPYKPDIQFEYGELLAQQGATQLAYRAFRETLKAPGGSAYTKDVSRYLGGVYAIQQITTGEADEAFPVFSADGNSIIYQTNESGNWDIVEKNISTGETKILVNSSADEELPCINSDGKKLLYTTNADDRRPIDNKFKVREIYLKDLETEIDQNLTESIADDWLPRFSFDGQYISFVTERSDLRSVPYTEKHSDIFTMENDGDFHTKLTDDESNEGGACFSVDSKKIFYHSNKNGSYDIYSMKSDGSLQMMVIGNPDVNEVNPYLSPDSQHFVYFSDQGGSYDIYQAGIDGSKIERLTFSPAENVNPVYSPDGKFVAFHSDQNGNYDVFIINLQATSQPTTQELIRRLDNLIK
jgi:Tol biopolymer transport system component